MLAGRDGRANGFFQKYMKCCTIFPKFQESLNFYLFVISKIVKVTLIFRGKNLKTV